MTDMRRHRQPRLARTRAISHDGNSHRRSSSLRERPFCEDRTTMLPLRSTSPSSHALAPCTALFWKAFACRDSAGDSVQPRCSAGTSVELAKKPDCLVYAPSIVTYSRFLNSNQDYVMKKLRILDVTEPELCKGCCKVGSELLQARLRVAIR